MGGSTRQRNADAKANRLEGTNIDVRGRDGKALSNLGPMGWVPKVRVKDAVASYHRRKNKASKPFEGTRSTNASLAIHRASTGYRSEQKFNETVGKKTPNFKSFQKRDEVGRIIASACGNYGGLGGDIKMKQLISFATTFLHEGLEYLDPTSGQDVDILLEFIASKFVDEQGWRCMERLVLVRDVAYWKSICKRYGAFLCPRHVRIVDGVSRVVHKIPSDQLRVASWRRIEALRRKHADEIPVVQATPGPQPLQGGGGMSNNPFGPLAGGGTGGRDGNRMVSKKIINKGTGGNSKVRRNLGSPNAVDPDPNGTGTRKEQAQPKGQNKAQAKPAVAAKKAAGPTVGVAHAPVAKKQPKQVAPANPAVAAAGPPANAAPVHAPQNQPKVVGKGAAAVPPPKPPKPAVVAPAQPQVAPGALADGGVGPDEGGDNQEPNHPIYGLVDETEANFIGGGTNGLGETDAIFSTQEALAITNELELLTNMTGFKVRTSIGEVADIDQHGAPFCGMTCVDIAARQPVNVKKYISRVGTNVIKRDGEPAVKIFTQDVIGTVGTDSYVKAYAQQYGLGVILLHRILDAQTGDYQYFQHSQVNNLSGKYVILVFSTALYDTGHYTLLMKTHSDVNHMAMEGKYSTPDWGCKILGTSLTLKFGQLVPRRTNADVRSYTNAREAIKLQGQNQIVTTRRHLWLCGYKIRVPFTKKTCVIDATRAHAMSREIATSMSSDVGDIVQVNLNLGREINSAPDPVVAVHTTQVMKHFAKKVRQAPRRICTEGMVTVNAPNSTAIIPDLDVIQANQRMAVQGGGRYKANHFEIPEWRDVEGEIKWRDVDKTKLNQVVATAPIGCPVDGGIPVGVGLISLTDEKGIVASGGGRGCSKATLPNADVDDNRAEFLKESLEFVDDMLSRTSVENIIPEDSTLLGLVNQFVRTNEGKKSRRWIDNCIRDYIKYKCGQMTIKQEKKYCRHSAFVKLESNIKRRDGKVFVRPRMIMTMSKRMQFELCYLANISDSWYAGPIADYQVKHMNPQDMIEKIRQAQDKPHCVTDYSAFESSITADVRRIEMHLLHTMCEKAGYFFTSRTLSELHLDLGRTIHQAGVRLLLNTRCSGDYWTSLGNGVVAICLMRFCHHRNNLTSDFVMLAEGDDGLVPIEVPNVEELARLGFKFSSETSGTRPGDTDFLRSLWEKRRWLNIGRVLSKIFWVKGNGKLKRSKQMFLLRSMALSLHYLSPGHPVLWAVVKLIEKKTRGYVAFKSAALFLDGWKEWDLSGKFPEVRVCEEMRARVAEGADGFPPLCITAQKVLERRLLSGNLNTIGILQDYPDFADNRDASDITRISLEQADMRRLYGIIGLPYREDDLSMYKEHGVVRQNPARGQSGTSTHKP